MNEVLTTGRKLAIQFKAIFWFALILFALSGLAVVGVLPWWMIALVVLVGIVLGLLAFLPHWLWNRNRNGYAPGKPLLVFSFAGILAAIGLAGWPILGLAVLVNTGTVTLPQATLSNGKKTVVFQGMQHVASEDFYKAVVFDLEQALTEGYTLFYEGVKPVEGRPDLDEWFNVTLRGQKQDLNAGYTDIAKTCGLNFQLTYFEPLLTDKAIHPSRHVDADVTYLQMKTEYDRLIGEDPAFASAMAAKAAKAETSSSSGDDWMLSLLSSAANATSEQKRLVGILCRGVFAYAVGGHGGPDTDPAQRIILDYRNRELARTVADSPAEKIYITYGAAHFPGFLADLKALDPAFEVQSLQWVRPMTVPVENLPPRNYPVVRRTQG